MHIEEQLCKRLKDILNGIFNEAGIKIEVYGNWIVDEYGGFKDVDSTGAGSRVYVKVMPRSYPEYTAKTAEMECRIEADFRQDDCPDGRKVNAAYAKLIDLLDLWHDDMGQVKHDLTIANDELRMTNGADIRNSKFEIRNSQSFDPCGLRLSGGQWDRTSDPTGWSLDQSFTIKGRIKRQ